MKKSMKHILLLAVVFPLVFAGCNDLFDKGDTEKAYEGPDVVEIKPQQSEVEEGGSSLTLDVQLISSEGLASSDLTVNFTTGGDAEAAHYDIPGGTSVTITSGSASASFTVNFPADSGLEEGEEVQLTITLQDGDGFEAAENLKTATIFIQGVDDSN